MGVSFEEATETEWYQNVLKLCIQKYVKRIDEANKIFNDGSMKIKLDDGTFHHHQA